MAGCTLGAYAHHSPFLFFDPSTTIEIEGELTSVQWRNPRVMFEAETADNVSWLVEANAVSILRRMNLTPESVRAGDRVSIAGWPNIDMTGIPNSPETHMIERFARSADGNRLDYTMTITNAEIFTQPVTLSKSWLNVPGATVEPYGCEE